MSEGASSAFSTYELMKHRSTDLNRFVSAPGRDITTHSWKGVENSAAPYDSPETNAY